MSRFRELDRKAHANRFSIPCRSVFLIEDSVALGLLLQSRLESRASVNVECFRTYADAAHALGERRPALAITGVSLPDAPEGEILDLLAGSEVPTILFTATLNRKIRERFTSPNIVDYFMKDAANTVEQIVNAIIRFTEKIATPVLIVDDMESSRQALVELLKHQNCRIYQASSGVQALDILAENEAIELVITDHHMSDMDGHELTKRIRTLYAPDRLRVIGISASSDSFLSASFLKAGASDFVYKPFIPEEVRYRIESNIDTLAQIKHLRFLAERDPLTGLYNRRAFFERSHGALDTLRAKEANGSVAILDIDHFKKVNDNYGHDTGDRVIKLVAKVLDDQCTENGILTARFGGEEFVILFTDMSTADVYTRCEQIRLAIADLAVPYEGASLGVTVSLGVAIFQQTEGIDNNLNAADQMLYMAKAGGRNRVIYDAVLCGV